MSRSRRKTKVLGIADTSDKDSKRTANRCLRHQVKRLLKRDEDDAELPLVREMSDVWDFEKDGKQYRSSASDAEMRK